MGSLSEVRAFSSANLLSPTVSQICTKVYSQEIGMFRT